MDIQIVKEDLTGAVVGTPGCGNFAMTYVKRMEHGNWQYYALSVAHGPLNYTMAGGTQFVAILDELQGKVNGVCLLKAGYAFGMPYAGRKDQDIVLLKLSELPETVEQEKILVWHDEKLEVLQDHFYGAYVVGESLKSPVIGRRAVYHENGGRWLFMLDSCPEPGHSGTAMVGFTKQGGSQFVLAVDEGEKERNTPLLMGVYTGKYDVIGLVSRASVCPIRPRDEFDLVDCVRPPDKIELWENVKPKGEGRELKKLSWKVVEGQTDLIEKIDTDHRKPPQRLRGVFVTTSYADKQNRKRYENESKPKRQGREREHSRKNEGDENVTDDEMAELDDSTLHSGRADPLAPVQHVTAEEGRGCRCIIL